MLTLTGAPLTIGGDADACLPDAPGLYDIEAATDAGPRRERWAVDDGQAFVLTGRF